MDSELSIELLTRLSTDHVNNFMIELLKFRTNKP